MITEEKLKDFIVNVRCGLYPSDKFVITFIDHGTFTVRSLEKNIELGFYMCHRSKTKRHGFLKTTGYSVEHTYEIVVNKDTINKSVRNRISSTHIIVSKEVWDLYHTFAANGRVEQDLIDQELFETTFNL